MNTEYAIGNIHIHFESQARRRWFVALFYAVLAASVFAGLFAGGKIANSQWVSVGCMILFVALFVPFTWVAGNMRSRGDEREMHRRDHAHFRAYYFFLPILMGELFIRYFREPNHFAPPLPLTLRGFLVQPNILSVSALLLYATLPQAILLWTEPDMEDPQTAS
jgi:hypothetical protein